MHWFKMESNLVMEQGNGNFLKNQLSETVKLRQKDFVSEKKYALSRFTLPSSLNPSK